MQLRDDPLKSLHFSAFNTSDFGPRGAENYTGPIKYNDTEVEGWKESCVFPGWKEDEFPYNHAADYYFVWMGRLAFLVMFQVSYDKFTGVSQEYTNYPKSTQSTNDFTHSTQR